MKKDFKERVLDVVKKDIIPFEDGFYNFMTRTGGLKAKELRIIADHLDDLNREWERKLERELWDGK